MTKTIKVVESTSAPNNINDLWLDKSKNTINHFSDGKWVSLMGEDNKDNSSDVEEEVVVKSPVYINLPDGYKYKQYSYNDIDTIMSIPFKTFIANLKLGDVIALGPYTTSMMGSEYYRKYTFIVEGMAENLVGGICPMYRFEGCYGEYGSMGSELIQSSLYIIDDPEGESIEFRIENTNMSW